MQVRNAVPALVVEILLFPAAAQAAPWAIRGYEPDAPIAGEQVTFHAERDNNGNGNPDSLVWGFGDGSGFGTGWYPTHVYDEPGTYSVKLYGSSGDVDTLDLQDSWTSRWRQDRLRLPLRRRTARRPRPSRSRRPARLSGRASSSAAEVTPMATPSRASGTSAASEPRRRAAPRATRTRPRGRTTVSLSVSDDRGGFASTSRDITVSPAAGQLPAVPGTDAGHRHPRTTPAPLPNRKPLARMRPFPVVRIAGVVPPAPGRS